ncbi:hypothetical protein HAX54_004461 [Datura stramonium]|uniref:Uncharacterized protein n=1 Tax=Datura stramonium TaxID=4076 RepID=A0ABS8T9D4_DATST|nr:hypothetical protein [Datura stramonium]
MEKMDSINLSKTEEVEAEEEDIISDENGNEKGNRIEKGKSNNVSKAASEIIDTSVKENGNVLGVIKPHNLLPQPESTCRVAVIVSPGELNRSQSMPESFDMPAIGKFFREKSNSLSSAITKRLSSMGISSTTKVMTIQIAARDGVRPLRTESDRELKTSGEEAVGRVSFLEIQLQGLHRREVVSAQEKPYSYVEINVDVYPQREKELIEAEIANVPQIFLNEAVRRISRVELATQ